MAENSEQRQPTHRVYSVIPEGGELVCQEIGSCNPSRDAYAVISDAAPEQETISACAAQ